MLKKERENEIVNILRSHDGYAEVKTLCAEMYVSESSVRRDLTRLEEKGIVNRVYGGAELVNIFSLASDFNVRRGHNSAQKQTIAKKAAKLIREGDVIFLDQSSSAFYLAREIVSAHKCRITVATNNIEIIGLLSESSVNVISSGGTLSRENRTCLVGNDAQATFDGICADRMFFSTKALSEDGVVSDCAREEIFVRNAMLRNAREKVFLCDLEKIGASAAYKQCTLGDVDYLVCEEKAEGFGRFDCLKKL